MTPQLTELLVESRQRGFLGPGPVEHHLDHARAFAIAVPEPPSHAVDLGAGGGLPGLVLAVEFWPATMWTFLDASERRTEFLRTAIADLGLVGRVDVVTARAEEFGRRQAARGAADLVVARSFGAPAVVVECAAPLLRVGGRLVVSEPPAGSSARWPTPALVGFGLGPAEALIAPSGAHLVCMVQETACPDRFPRRVGIPAKRPVF